MLGKSIPQRPLQGIKSMDFLFVNGPKTQQVFSTLKAETLSEARDWKLQRVGTKAAKGKIHVVLSLSDSVERSGR